MDLTESIRHTLLYTKSKPKVVLALSQQIQWRRPWHFLEKFRLKLKGSANSFLSSYNTMLQYNGMTYKKSHVIVPIWLLFKFLLWCSVASRWAKTENLPIDFCYFSRAMNTLWGDYCMTSHLLLLCMCNSFRTSVKNNWIQSFCDMRT